MDYDLGRTKRGFSSTTCFHFGLQGQTASELRNQVGKGPMDPFQCGEFDLGARGCDEGIIPSSILKFFGMYVICIKDNALFKGDGDVIP